MFGCSVARSNTKMIFEEKKVLVIGTGKSGIAAAQLLQKKHAKLYVYDGNTDLTEEMIKKKSEAFAQAEILIGDISENTMNEIDMAVISPGVPMDQPLILRIKDHFIPVIGEVELAYQCGAGRLAAITGTNGKTTTTALVGEILGAFYKDTKVVGNIGIPYTSVAADMTDETVTVAEISSFQLESTVHFAPEVTAILNITPDHLDRHHTMENYVKAKESITKNQKPSQVCVLNYEDERLREFAKKAPCKVVFFSSAHELKDGFFYDGKSLFVSVDGNAKKLLDVTELKILGVHNYENAMAAAAVSFYMGVPMDTIVKALKNFHAVEHRIEYVATKRGVRYYNDSKGTNPDAAIKGICAMDRPTWLIAGGYDKQSEYDEWVEKFDGRVRGLVLIGATREKIAACCDKHGFHDYIMKDTFDEAVDYCHEKAVEGEAVLLSPACASWGMFRNYEQRGEIFKEIVNRYEE